MSDLSDSESELASVTDTDADSSDQPREILPAMGAWVVYTIDPVSSLSPEAQDDPDAVAACGVLQNKQYVGFVAERLELFLAWEPYNSCAVRLLQQGDPETLPEGFIQPDMSLLVCPVTTRAHPSSRPPLRSSKPLPWSDCYVSAFMTASVRSPTAFTVAPIEYMIDDDEMMRQVGR
ncbi:hypothetical protein C8R47DRAFT_554645 [Mycena vitilis]|nr:hypothetical protein C8R47DRAFT_554645 [Mycena vitilis]